MDCAAAGTAMAALSDETPAFFNIEHTGRPFGPPGKYLHCDAEFRWIDGRAIACASLFLHQSPPLYAMFGAARRGAPGARPTVIPVENHVVTWFQMGEYLEYLRMGVLTEDNYYIMYTISARLGDIPTRERVVRRLSRLGHAARGMPVIPWRGILDMLWVAKHRSLLGRVIQLLVSHGPKDILPSLVVRWTGDAEAGVVVDSII